MKETHEAKCGRTLRTASSRPSSHSTAAKPSAPCEITVREWEIWHTYATYLHVTNVDLDAVARKLVEAGIALCAMLQDGRTYWNSERTVCCGQTILEPDGLAGICRFSIEYDDKSDDKMRGFAKEAWYQAARFRYAEDRVFGADSSLPPPYLRAFLGQCRLVPSTRTQCKTDLYPTLIVYESGVMVLELRSISPKSPAPLSEFIAGGVNLFQFPFQGIEASPGLVNLAAQAYEHSTRARSFVSRGGLIWLQRGHEESVRQLTRRRKAGPFQFELAPMSSSRDVKPSENLKTLALTIFHTTAFAISRPRSGVSFLLRGQRHTAELGDFWSGRPHIYLVRFDGQCDTASENARQHEAAFRKILLRIPVSDSSIERCSLPRDCRLFDDYNAYITSAATLCAWSTHGIDRYSKWADANRGHLIYEHQAVIELLEYGCMLHRWLLGRAHDHGNQDQVFAARRALNRLSRSMTLASQSGEIMELLNYGWKQLKVPQLREQIDDALRLRQEETSSFEARTTTRVGNLLTVLFGLVAIPSLAGQVVEPAWHWLELPLPGGDVAFQMLANAVAFAIVIPLVLLLLIRPRFGRRRTPPTDL